MLGTGFFTLTAADTFTGLSVFQRKVVVINRLAGKTACGAGNAVVQSKILGNSDIFRTSVGTANSHFPRPAGPHFPASQGHIKRPA